LWDQAFICLCTQTRLRLRRNPEGRPAQVQTIEEILPSSLLGQFFSFSVA